ncbi:hypothetical protein AVEN_133438-1 [Araneus ventricosus]|uniref:Peptidase A2 domain-containing protein n=1 Tax=Araneus ventricosus TaxID=182803 RepID=A0A4Y2R691_ARAVE|nr:hypothetical protein AVEN_8413-1 [Araneus ventricosus]GBN71187.1 hypothetical protein AVEN_106861-1 [Araneus ventricosus]GBN75444.1 hypothetical protein AVEN_230297-1 [Araneus ventricosus]GBN75464.1 hypothetical protein AVEN_133438-1 [Araneus ventricosus]
MNLVKASQLVASLRGTAAEVLQGIPADTLTDLTTIEKAVESRFGDSHLTQFFRTELRQDDRSRKKAFKAPEEGPRVSSLSGKKNGLYLEGSICGIQCLMLVDTGANVTLLRTDLAQKLKEQLIYTAPNISLKTATASVQHSKSCSVLAKKRTIIPARSECLIQGVPEVPGQFRYAVTDFPSQTSQKGVLVAATLVDLEMEAIPVRVLNVNNKPKIQDKRDVIATCEPVVDIVARPQEFSGAQHLPSTSENFQILNEEQRTAARKLLNEFQNLFSTGDADVGRCNMTQHRINTGDHPSIKQYRRRLPLARKEEADHLVKEMADNGII